MQKTKAWLCSNWLNLATLAVSFVTSGGSALYINQRVDTQIEQVRTDITTQINQYRLEVSEVNANLSVMGQGNTIDSKKECHNSIARADQSSQITIGKIISNGDINPCY